MSFFSSIEVVVGLIFIHLYIQKLNRRFYLRTHLLLTNHIIRLLLEARFSVNTKAHWHLLEWLMPKQQLKIKGPIIDIDNRFNEIISSFSSFNYEFLLGYRLVDIFPNYFVFHSLDRKSDSSVKNHLHNLKNITL